jgi:phosphatidate cytidylyltransferase
MNAEINKRVFTSIVLLSILYLSFVFEYVLLITLIIISVIIWVEFKSLIDKIFIKNKSKDNLIKFLFRVIALIYLSFFSVVCWIAFSKIMGLEFRLISLYILGICVVSDIGGLIFGKIFKGKKLTKISPNKTISGSFGSLFFSLILLTIYILISSSINFFFLLLLTLAISLISQIGDLLISYIKRKAKVKDTSNILPGHGGLLDRLDGILFALPIGVLIIIYI